MKESTSILFLGSDPEIKRIIVNDILSRVKEDASMDGGSDKAKIIAYSSNKVEEVGQNIS